MLIPRGFAHGYLTPEDSTLMQWCVDNDFCGDAAKAVQFDDPDIKWQTVPWPEGEYIAKYMFCGGKFNASCGDCR